MGGLCGPAEHAVTGVLGPTVIGPVAEVAEAAPAAAAKVSAARIVRDVE